MQTLILKAPAKVNYLLDVIRRRPDGYHELRMIMQRINLCDDISITVTDAPGIKVTCSNNGVPDGPDNIAWKAARIMLDLSGTNMGAMVEITKNIPVAAGLGGGSSDAATVLMGLNQLLKLDLPDQRLMDVGVTLGADVPFFIFKKTALAEGIGDKLSEMPQMPKAWILLVNPGVHVSTAWVYRSLVLTSERVLSTLPEFYGTIKDICSIFSNDLESVTIPAYPVIAEIKQQMIDLGAACSMMSGSGSTVFGVFDNSDKAFFAAKEMSIKADWFVKVVETL
ncbi:MAG: 4-(cytidine 5'-diphospho)-2-C-methyl-D-erythritol kinase [Geobacter sp.]|nr:4-(cytidine 5'-diphospho)-2-C-methyl-D-erythritol kinase [Geobacter sp.]